MATSYSFIVRDRNGILKYSLGGYNSVSWGRSLNSVGALVMEIPVETFPMSIYDSIDNRIEIWRRVSDSTESYIDGKTCYFIRRIEETISKEGANVLKITAYDTISLLARRIVAYETDSLEATQWDNTDNMMKEIVRQNLGADVANPNRDLSTYIDVEGNQTLGPVIYKTFAWENVLSVLQDIADASLRESLGPGGGADPQFLFFDIEYSPYSTKQFRFRTYIDQIGQDRTTSGQFPLTVKAPSANIPMASKIYDYSSELNVVYALGQGYDDAIETVVTQDDTRIKLSPFNRNESSIKIQDTEDIDELQSEADAYLQKRRPKIYLEADMLDSKEIIFGRDYNYGDRIMVNAKGTVFKSHVASYKIDLQGGAERVNIRLRGEEYVLS